MADVSANYNPYQQWNPQFMQGANPGAAGVPTMQDAYGNTQDVGQALHGVGSNAPQYGYNDYRNSAGSGAGQIFSQQREAQAVNALNAGLSNNEGDVALRNQARNALNAQYGALNPAADSANLNSQYDTGLNNSLSIARRQMGGSGISGSQQGGNVLGNIVSQSNAGRLNAQAGLQQQQATTLGALNNAESNTLQQSLAERGYNLGQASSLADLLQRQSSGEMGYLSSTRDAAPSPFTFQQGLGAAIGAGGVAAKFLA